MYILCNDKIFTKKYLYLRLVSTFVNDEDFASKVYTPNVPRVDMANRGR